jgi:hypothetical protein
MAFDALLWMGALAGSVFVGIFVWTFVLGLVAPLRELLGDGPLSLDQAREVWGAALLWRRVFALAAIASLVMVVRGAMPWVVGIGIGGVAYCGLALIARRRMIRSRQMGGFGPRE